jgi:steroid delta-isomerase-like uncharacterized protein
VNDAPEPESIVRTYLDALNRGDADAAAACVSNDFSNEHTASIAESVRGRSAYRQRLAQFFAEFGALHYEIEDLICDRDRIAVAYRLSARWRGTDRAQPLDKPFQLRGMFRFRVADGLISQRVDYFDSAEFQRQVR